MTGGRKKKVVRRAAVAPATAAATTHAPAGSGTRVDEVLREEKVLLRVTRHGRVQEVRVTSLHTHYPFIVFEVVEEEGDRVRRQEVTVHYDPGKIPAVGAVAAVGAVGAVGRGRRAKA